MKQPAIFWTPLGTVTIMRGPLLICGLGDIARSTEDNTGKEKSQLQINVNYDNILTLEHVFWNRLINKETHDIQYVEIDESEPNGVHKINGIMGYTGIEEGVVLVFAKLSRGPDSSLTTLELRMPLNFPLGCDEFFTQYDELGLFEKRIKGGNTVYAISEQFMNTVELALEEKTALEHDRACNHPEKKSFVVLAALTGYIWDYEKTSEENTAFADQLLPLVMLMIHEEIGTDYFKWVRRR